MQPKKWFVLLLLVVVCLLFAYSCFSVVPTAVTGVNMHAEETVYHTYYYNATSITTIQLKAKNATVRIHAEDKRKEILVQATNTTIEGAERQKEVILQCVSDLPCILDIYLPMRSYHILLEGTELSVNTEGTTRGIVEVKAEIAHADLNGHCGGFFLSAKEGGVSLKNGNLSKTSYVFFKERGNIYLDTAISDKTGLSIFETQRGIIKVQQESIKEPVYFEVSALATEGEYRPLEAADRKNSSYIKAQLNAHKGIVCFE